METSTTDGITYEFVTELEEAELNDLYNDAGWTLYTKDIGRLREAVSNSLLNVTAREGNELIGLIRCVGDGKTILYIQDILVHSRYKRQGIGTRLIEIVQKKFSDVRQIVLITDEDEVTKNFYEAVGFESAVKRNLACFVRIKS